MVQIEAPGWFPDAIHKPIRPGENDPSITPTQLILHTAVSQTDSLYDWFNGPSDGIESHGYIRKDGNIEQYRGIFWEADANYLANVRATSWETQGMGSEPWTDPQLRSIRLLINWQHKIAGLPYKTCRNWDSPGVGYHIMHDEWHPDPKSCPGPLRIRQFNNQIVPWLRENNWTKEELLSHLDAAIKEGKEAPNHKRLVKDVLEALKESRRLLTD